MAKEISDADLDKMIDESVASGKKEPKKEGGKKPKKEERPKVKANKPETERKESVGAKSVPSPTPSAAPAGAVAPITEYDPWGVLKYPNLAEKAMNMVELENKLVFVVRKNANKAQIKEAVEKGFDVTVLGVNVELTPKGDKRAYIKLGEKDSAADIASRMGML